MVKFLKGLVITIIILVIILGAIIFSPILSISVKKGIEHFGSQTLQTEVSVDRVRVNVLKGNIAIKGLVVANPEGFKSEHIFKMDHIAVDVEPKSLKSDVIVINSVLIEAPEIVLEKMGRNIRALNAGVGKAPRPKTDGKTTSIDKPAKQLIIKNFDLNDAVVLVEGKLKLSLPDIALNNLGSEDNPMSIKGVISKVLNVITQDSLKAVSKVGKKRINDLSKSASEKFKSLFNK